MYRLSLIDSISFRENRLIFLGIWGEAELILGIWGAKEKYFQGAEVLSFRELGRSMHYFQGSREHRPPPPRAHRYSKTLTRFKFLRRMISILLLRYLVKINNLVIVGMKIPV